MASGKSIVLAALAASIVGSAAAQGFPERPVRLVNPFAPGGATDLVARAVAKKLGESWGQPVVVENKAGAGGAIGVESVARSPADGYTLLIGTQTTHAAAPALNRRLPYDPSRFVPLTLAGSTPLVLIVHPSVPVKTVGELVAFAKANPGRLSYGSGGSGTSQHIAGELFKSLSKTHIVHIPYKGAGPAMADLLAGQIQLMFDNLPSAMAQVSQGRLSALAVTNPRRTPLAPAIPTMEEAGIGGMELATWFAFYAPPGAPEALAGRISRDMRAALEAPDVRSAFAAAGVDIHASTPDELRRFQDAELAKWARLVRLSGATQE